MWAFRRCCSFLPKVLLSLRCCWTLILFSSYIWLTWPPIFYSWHTLTVSHIQCQVIVNLQLNYLEQFTHHLLGINHPELDVLQLPVSFPPWVSFALWPFDVNHISPSKITVRLAQVNKPDGLWGCFFILSANVSSDREGRLRSNCWLVKGYNEILNSESGWMQFDVHKVSVVKNYPWNISASMQGLSEICNEWYI